MNRLRALLTGHCPHCRQGKIFRSFWKMHETCSVCQIRYEREDGYWMMSIFVAYTIYFAIIIPTFFAQFFLEWEALPTAITLISVCLLTAPFVFRISRIVWLHIDELIDPRDKQAKD